MRIGRASLYPSLGRLNTYGHGHRSIVIECHFAFPSIMKTCIGGVKVAKLQFRLFRVSQGLPPMLIGKESRPSI